MDMLCGVWLPRCGGLLMYTQRRYTNVYIRSVLMQAGPCLAPLRAGSIGTGLCGSLHLYPAPQHVVLPDRGGTALRGDPRGPRGQSMQDPASELPRIPLPRTPVNKEQTETFELRPLAGDLGLLQTTTSRPQPPYFPSSATLQVTSGGTAFARQLLSACTRETKPAGGVVALYVLVS